MTAPDAPLDAPRAEHADAARAVRRAAVRAGLLVLSFSVAEETVRGAISAARFVDASSALLEAFARTGRIVALAAPLWLLDLAASTLAGTRLGQALALRSASALRQLTRPARSARLLAIFAVALAVAGRVSRSQLPWHSGAVVAAFVLLGAALLELGLAHLRKEAAPLRANCTVGALWIAGLLLFATLIASFVGQAELGAAVTALGALVFARGISPAFDVRWRTLGVVFLLATGLVVLDAEQPALRRFASAYTPYSALGAELWSFVTDLDGDGASRLFGLDCDDLDAARGPLTADLPDDGIDQNCRNGDSALARALSRYGPGGLHPVMTAPARPPARPSLVLVISVDALRADVFEDGSSLPQTLAWAKGCVRFTQARANSNSTGTSLLSLHSGVYARHVSTDDGSWLIDLASPKARKMSVPPTLAAALSIAGGYSTTVVFPAFHVPNFEFLTGYELGGTLPDTGSAAFQPASVALAELRARWAAAPKDRPVHLRVHLMDLHAPYPAGSGRSGYLGSAKMLDSTLGQFLRSLPKDALVVLTADHGEAFTEHGYTEHGHTLFDEELRVPLVFCAPPEFSLGPPRAVAAAVSLVDVMPTVLDLLGIAVPYRRQGESLLPLLAGGGTKHTPWVFFEATDFSQQGVLLGCDKWLENAGEGWRALFDVCQDPGETADLSKKDPERAERMQALLGEIVDLDLDAFRSWRLGREILMQAAP